MMIILRMFIMVCSACILVLPAGCAIFPKDKMIGSSTDYNVVVEKAQNNMILINIVRASKRYPMYFTNFKQLRGSMAYNFSTGSITVPFGGPGDATSYSVAPTISYSTNPSFDLNVLDDKEFLQGMTTSVSLEMIDFYLKHGWPDLMLWNLLIDSIEPSADGKLRNYPLDVNDFNKFQEKLVKMFTQEKCSIESLETFDVIGPEIKESALSVERLIDIGKAGLKLSPVKDAKGAIVSYQLETQAKKNYQLRCEDAKSSYRLNSREGAPTGSVLRGTVYLRSPEAILYYLGEILRAEEMGFVPRIDISSTYCKNKPVPLFLVAKKDKDSSVWEIADKENAYIEVGYDGDKYAIPRWKEADSKDECLADRSMHVMSLISLIISTQRIRENVPATGVVTVIGR